VSRTCTRSHLASRFELCNDNILMPASGNSRALARTKSDSWPIIPASASMWIPGSKIRKRIGSIHLIDSQYRTGSLPSSWGQRQKNDDFGNNSGGSGTPAGRQGHFVESRMGASTDAVNAAPSPIPAHQTGRAQLTHLMWRAT
jgi:hypothetical protein